MLKTTETEFKNDLEESLNEFGLDQDTVVEVECFLSGETTKNFAVTVTVNGVARAFNYTLHAPNELLFKRLKKRFLKVSVYRTVSEHLGKSLPWGSLTGIRPTRLAYQMIEENGEFESSFQNDLFVSKQKVELVKAILREQQPIYCKNDSNTDFFVSIPFCPSRCSYCSFVSNEIAKVKNLDEYVTALCKEIEESKKLIKNLRAVYVGGGTPVSLSPAHLQKIMQAIGRQNVEYTVEAGRPDVIGKENLQILKDFGVTRVCVNPQTFCNETLKILGRKHTADDVYRAFDLVKSFGFEINMDFIAGLTGEDVATFANSIDQAVRLSPDNITVHTLALKRGSVLKEQVSRLGGESVAEMVDYAQKTLTENGYNPYYMYRQKYMAGNLENVGYCKKGKACIYNVDIMEETTQIIACGAHSVSKWVGQSQNRIERIGAPKDIATYVNKVDEIIAQKKELFR